jgi:hypothetical protein
MSNPLQKPAVHYGLGLMSAAVLAFVAFQFLDGTIQLVVLAIAAVELVVTPQILKRAGEQGGAAAR